MGRISISKSDDWHVEHDRQDVRGWEVRDADGHGVGRVRDLIADTDTALVDTLVLDDGREVPAADVEIGYDDKVVYTGLPTADKSAVESAKYEDARIRERKEGETTGFAAHEPSFREHYRESYADSDREYSHYHPAYRIGYDYGTDDTHHGSDWDAVRGDVRSDYEKRHGEGTWDRVKDAARHAFERARARTKSGTSGGTTSGTTTSGTTRTT